MSNAEKPVYIVSQFNVNDLEDFMRRYAYEVIDQLYDCGAEILAADHPEKLEGNAQFNRTVVIKFPNREVAMKWYKSDAYQPFKTLRKSELTSVGEVVLVDEFDRDALK